MLTAQLLHDMLEISSLSSSSCLVIVVSLKMPVYMMMTMSECHLLSVHIQLLFNGRAFVSQRLTKTVDQE